MAELNCIVVTPEATVLDTKAEFVALPLFDGEAGILPGRSPMIGRLGFGELRVRTGGSDQLFYVDGGFVQVADNVVSVLTNRAIPASEVDSSAAAEQLDIARKRRASGDDEFDQRDRAIGQARAQMRVAKHAR